MRVLPGPWFLETPWKEVKRLTMEKQRLILAHRQEGTSVQGERENAAPAQTKAGEQQL